MNENLRVKILFHIRGKISNSNPDHFEIFSVEDLKKSFHPRITSCPTSFSVDYSRGFSYD
jgi:hypothetical protein